MQGRKWLTLVLAGLMIAVMLTSAGFVAASQQLPPPVYTKQNLPNMNVTWYRLTNTVVNESHWEINSWVFGPSPILRIYNATSGDEIPPIRPIEF